MDILKYTIALEADDITKEVIGEKEKTLNDSSTEKVDSLDNAMNKLDDLAGDEDSDPEEDEDGSIDNDEAGEDDDDNTDQDDVIDDNTDDPSNIENTKQPETFMDKNKIKKNLIHLYSTVSGEIDVLTDSLNNTNNLNTIKIVNDVIEHLKNIKDYSYKIIANEINTLSYDQLLQKYVALERIYEVATEMLTLYFNNKPGDDTKKNA